MMASEITSVVGGKRGRRRVGRGTGSGRGKTCGRGHKGAGSRSGWSSGMQFEGGQMPLFRRLPKRGFNNRNFARSYAIVNVNQLERFDDGTSVNAEQLSRVGLIDDPAVRVKILGNGSLSKRLDVFANKFSKSAEYKIVASGGTAKVI